MTHNGLRLSSEAVLSFQGRLHHLRNRQLSGTVYRHGASARADPEASNRRPPRGTGTTPRPLRLTLKADWTLHTLKVSFAATSSLRTSLCHNPRFRPGQGGD